MSEDTAVQSATPAGAAPATPGLGMADVGKEYPIGNRLRRDGLAVHAVSGVSLSVASGETLGMVGESGCGKTTTGRLAMRLIEPTSGSIRFRGQELVGLSSGGMRKLRQRMQIV